MTDIKQDVKVFVKVFIQVFVSSVVKESTKKMIKSLSQRQRKLLEAKSKKMSDDQIVQYFNKSSFFKKTLENTVKSVCDLPSSKGTGSLIGKLESFYEATSTFNNPINTLILPASKTIVTVAASTAVVTTAAVIIITNPAPTANFASNVTEGYTPLSVQFYDSSENATVWNWSFGDGGYSSERDPAHTYYAAGDYTVKLKVSNENGTDSKSAKIKVLQPVIVPVLPVASFSSNTTQGVAPLSVQFIDLSQNAQSRSWDFGDGINSTEQNPAHTYSAAGNYTVNLTATNINGTNSKLDTINVLKSTPTINWSNPADILYGTALNSSQLNASASVPGTFLYTPRVGTVLSAGIHTLHVNFTPDDAANYSNSSSNVTINVAKSIPIIAWNNPSDVIYGTPLSSIQLNASSSVSGTFVYALKAGTILSADRHTLHVNFTPDDIANYISTSKDVRINVLRTRYAYIANAQDSMVSMVDPASNSVVDFIEVGVFPVEVAVNPAGTTVYVTNGGSYVPNGGSNSVSVIDTATNTVTATIAVGYIPWGVAVTPDGAKVYVANGGSNNISVIDTATNTVTDTVPVGTSPSGVAVSPDGKKAYVANRGSNNISVIDTATNTVTDTVPVGTSPRCIVVSPDGRKAYVANGDSNDISVIDTSNNTVTTTVGVGSFPWVIAVNPTGTRVYVGNQKDHSVSVIDTSNNTVTATVDVGRTPSKIEVSPDGMKVYMDAYSHETLSVSLFQNYI